MIQQSNNHNLFYFAGIFSIIFLISFIVFSFSGLAPKTISFYDYFFNKPPEILGNPIIYQKDGDAPYVETYTRPDKIVIKKIGVESVVQQPNTRDVTALDGYLNKGAVHYPGSGSIEAGNIFIFGHSADLFTGVQNPAYKVFNNLSKLSKGDTIELTADGEMYTYTITNVSLMNENEALIRFDSTKNKLTISTCNTFGKRQDRWVVEAELLN